MSDLTLSLRQARAAKVAEFAFKQRLERIEWEEKELKPYLERLQLEAVNRGEIPEFTIDYEDNSDE